MKKKIMFAFMLLACLLVMPNVYAAAPTLEEVTPIFPTDATVNNGQPVVTKNGNTTTVTFKAMELKMVAADPSIGRMGEASWLGVKVVAPKELTVDQLKKTTFRSVSWKGTESTDKSFWQLQDTPQADRESQEKTHYIELYARVNEEILTAATKDNKEIVQSWNINWAGDKSVVQTINIVFKAEDIISVEKTESDEKVWDETKYEEVKKEAAAEKAKQKPVVETEAEEENPSTSDNLLIYTSLSVVALISTLGTGLYLRKN